MRLLISFFFLFFLSQISFARAFYWNEYFGYGDFGKTSGTTLMLENTSDELLIKTIKIDAEKSDFSFSARVENKYIDSRQRYTYTDYSIGSRCRINDPAWGVLVRSTDGNNSFLLQLSIGESTDWEYTAQDCISAGLYKWIEGDSSIYRLELIDKKILFDSDVEIFRGKNSVTVSRTGDSLNFMVGRGVEKKLFSVSVDACFSELGFVVFPPCRVEVETIELEISDDLKAELSSEFTDSALTDYLHTSTDASEGYWKVLDRSFDENLLRMGGNYTFAMVSRDYGYDLLYVSGAEVCAGNWSTGMTKARLISTDINGVFKIVWFDSEMRALQKDIVAQIENGNVMTITFPYQNSKLRLYKSGLPTAGSSTAP